MIARGYRHRLAVHWQRRGDACMVTTLAVGAQLYSEGLLRVRWRQRGEPHV